MHCCRKTLFPKIGALKIWRPISTAFAAYARSRCGNQSQHYPDHRCLCLDLSGRITTPDRFS